MKYSQSIIIYQTSYLFLQSEVTSPCHFTAIPMQFNCNKQLIIKEADSQSVRIIGFHDSRSLCNPRNNTFLTHMNVWHRSAISSSAVLVSFSEMTRDILYKSIWNSKIVISKLPNSKQTVWSPAQWPDLCRL